MAFGKKFSSRTKTIPNADELSLPRSKAFSQYLLALVACQENDVDGARAFFTVGKAKADALGYDGQKDYFRYYVEARIENCAGNYLIAIDLLNEGIQAVLGFDLMEAHFRREIISPLFSIGDFKEAEKQRARANAVYELYDAPLLLIPPWPGLEKAAP